jgi:REP-associated tyrosine transposase
LPRARRHYLPGYIWHITHRCHKKEFLLKFAKDRRRWMYWLFKAKKRFGLTILGYMITSNHIHLLVNDDGPSDVISKSMQLIAGRTGQEYNQRKHRKGAFWEDRYHATAIDGDDHLFRCMVYIDMNMVRTGIVSHPLEWEFCGYNEIQNPRKRYALINYKKLIKLFHRRSIDDFKGTYNRWIEEALRIKRHVRDRKWTQSVAVGGKEFVEKTKDRLGYRADGRKVVKLGEDYQLREQQTSYIANSGHEKVTLSDDNTYIWNVSALN